MGNPLLLVEIIVSQTRATGFVGAYFAASLQEFNKCPARRAPGTVRVFSFSLMLWLHDAKNVAQDQQTTNIG